MWTPSGCNLRRASGRKDTQKAMRSLGIRSGVSPMNSRQTAIGALQTAMDSLMVTLGDLDRKIGFELVQGQDRRTSAGSCRLRFQLRC